MEDEHWWSKREEEKLRGWEEERKLKRFDVCEWERERKSWSSLKENEKEVLCVEHGESEKNSVKVIYFWINF